LIFFGLIVGEYAIDNLTGVFQDLPGSETVAILLVPGLACLWLFVWLLPRLALAMPASALEDLNGIKALRRGWALSKGTRGRILLTWGVISFLLWVGQSVAQFVLKSSFHFVARHFDLPGLVHLISLPAALLTISIVTLTGPINHIALTLFYYDQRIRKEGFDIEWMMESAGLNSAQTQPPEASREGK
jgi:hypothetical protein